MHSQLVALFASVAALGGCSIQVNVSRSGDGAVDVAHSLHRAWRDHLAAAKQKNAAAACDLYADDVVYAIAGQPELRGRAAVEAMETASVARTSLDDPDHDSIAVRVDGTTAHEIGTVTAEVADGDAPARHTVFHYVAEWRRGADGRWRIAHLVGHMEGARVDSH